MSIADLFENFDANSNANTNVPTMSDDDLEDIRLAAYTHVSPVEFQLASGRRWRGREPPVCRITC